MKDLKDMTVSELMGTVSDIQDRLEVLESDNSPHKFKKGDIVRIISRNPVGFTTGSEFKVGTICKVEKGEHSHWGSPSILIALPFGLVAKNSGHDGGFNVCNISQVKLIEAN